MTHSQLINELKNIITVSTLQTYRMQERLEDLKKGWEINDILYSIEKGK